MESELVVINQERQFGIVMNTSSKAAVLSWCDASPKSKFLAINY